MCVSCEVNREELKLLTRVARFPSQIYLKHHTKDLKLSREKRFFCFVFFSGKRVVKIYMIYFIIPVSCTKIGSVHQRHTFSPSTFFAFFSVPIPCAFTLPNNVTTRDNLKTVSNSKKTSTEANPFTQEHESEATQQEQTPKLGSWMFS